MEVLKEQWASGDFSSEKPYESHIMNEGALSRYRLARDLLELTHEELEEGLNEQVGS